MDYKFKRITLLSGHYGSGKTNIALNMAFALKRQTDNVAIADIDIVNPYFRTKDSKAELEAAGIKLICSEYAGTNLDVPALPQELYAVTDDRLLHVIMDIGGDDRGALALGRYTPSILEENDYEMLFVINCYRPLTANAADTVAVMREIEYAGGIPFTAIINNSNLGYETTAHDVLASVGYADEVSRMTGLPVKLTTVMQPLYGELSTKLSDLLPLRLQKKIN